MTEYLLKINGAISIPESLDDQKSVMVGVECDIFATEKRNREHDGTFVITYKSKAVGMPLVSQGPKKYVAVVKSKLSQAWRYRVMDEGEDYESFMKFSLANFDKIYEFIRELRKN
jgi:hypothetical protein